MFALAHIVSGLAGKLNTTTARRASPMKNAENLSDQDHDSSSQDHSIDEEDNEADTSLLSHKKILEKVGLNPSIVSFAFDLYKSGIPGTTSKVPTFIRQHGTCSVRLNRNDKMGKAISEHLISATGGKGSQHVVLKPSFDLSSQHNDESSGWEDEPAEIPAEEPGNTGMMFQIEPTSGFQWFRFDGRIFFLEHPSKNDRHGGKNSEDMLVSCLGRSIEPLKSFLIHCQNESERGMKFTNIYVAEPGAHITADYYSHIQKPSRALHTVDLPRKDFDDILSDAEDYFDPETKSYYRENGRPHRRGYLFYGPPGTGKTSLSVALASHFDLPLYVLNLNEQGLDDNGLLTRFGHLPERCVVLLEDIDSAGISRTSMKDEDESSEDSKEPDAEDQRSEHSSENHAVPKKATPKKKAVPVPRVTLSGLLNAIDGPAAPEGRLLIMTTNAPKSLDEALYRDGRVDKVVYLGYCTKETAAITFRRIFWTDPRAKGRFTQAEITTMAKDFGRQMPKDTFTPAQIQNFCMDRRGKPHRAISEFEAYKLGRLTGANQFKYDLAEKLDNGEEATKLEDVEHERSALADLESVDFSYLFNPGKVSNRGATQREPPERKSMPVYQPPQVQQGFGSRIKQSVSAANRKAGSIFQTGLGVNQPIERLIEIN